MQRVGKRAELTPPEAVDDRQPRSDVRVRAAVAAVAAASAVAQHRRVAGAVEGDVAVAVRAYGVVAGVDEALAISPDVSERCARDRDVRVGASAGDAERCNLRGRGDQGGPTAAEAPAVGHE